MACVFGQTACRLTNRSDGFRGRNRNDDPGLTAAGNAAGTKRQSTRHSEGLACLPCAAHSGFGHIAPRSLRRWPERGSLAEIQPSSSDIALGPATVQFRNGIPPAQSPALRRWARHGEVVAAIPLRQQRQKESSYPESLAILVLNLLELLLDNTVDPFCLLVKMTEFPEALHPRFFLTPVPVCAERIGKSFGDKGAQRNPTFGRSGLRAAEQAIRDFEGGLQTVMLPYLRERFDGWLLGCLAWSSALGRRAQ